jgi:hypothetical protein
MDLARRDHGRDATIKTRVDPTQLVLPRRPVASHRMDVAVDKARRHRHAIGIDNVRRPARINVLPAPDLRDPAADRHDRIGVDNRLLKRP